jgi:hypothetical protein
MSSVRYLSVQCVDPSFGVVRLVCDWNKGNTFSTGMEYETGHGSSDCDNRATHHSLAAALARCARLAKKMKV